MKIGIVNESYPVYNLCTHKMLNLFRSQGHEVCFAPRVDMLTRQCDKVYLSAIFTWHLPGLVYDINTLKQDGIDLEAGGPACNAMPEYIIEQTGIQPKLGLDERFEHVPGDDYQMVFTSRGCPRGCDFCLVQIVEGRKMIEYNEFPIPVGENPWAGDNNILATSWAHQELVVSKFKHVKNLDLNSGFDDRIFAMDPEKYWNLYSQLNLERWRFAYDRPEQREVVKFCADFLHSKGVGYSRISVFCLVGGGVGGEPDTFDAARERCQYLIDIGTSPYAMRYRPLKSLVRDYVPPGWNDKDMELLFAYYNVPWKWRTVSWEDFRYKFSGEIPLNQLQFVLE